MNSEFKIPDIYPLCLREGIKILEKHNIKNYSIKKTSAPKYKSTDISEDMRIVRIKQKADKTVEVVVCEK